ncbi:hypothetical protein AL544_003240 [Vibrio mimicus]|uniref:Uncharacterized protein n=1 Tax=Vibrio mimicus TaxID=674 RepID=A0A2J9VLN2_VIBMI|nr:hypothetical protein AL544_003240 [Vibrio mimicus]
MCHKRHYSQAHNKRFKRALCLISITNCHCFYIQCDVFDYHLELEHIRRIKYDQLSRARH